MVNDLQQWNVDDNLKRYSKKNYTTIVYVDNTIAFYYTS